MSDEKFLTPREFAEREDVSYETVHRWMREGKLGFVKARRGATARPMRLISPKNLTDYYNSQNEIVLIQGGSDE